MEGKKVFQNTDQKVKVKLDAGESVNLMPTSVYRSINPQMFGQNGAPWLEKFDKDWTSLVLYGGSIIKLIGVKCVACKLGKKNFIINLHILYDEKHPVLFKLSILGYLGLFVEHPLLFIETRKIRPMHMIKKSDTQKRKGTLQEPERPLEVPKVGDLFHSTPASYPCQGDLPKAQE